MLIVGPVLAVAGLIALVAVAAAVIVPLLPLAFIALAIWFVIRVSQRPARRADPGRAPLVVAAGAEQRRFVPRPPGQLQPDRQVHRQIRTAR